MVDDSTPGLYNQGIGWTLNPTTPYGLATSLFPVRETGLHATFGPGDEADLSTAASALGTWLSDPLNPGGAWSAAPVAIPSTWARQTETAIIYALDRGAMGLANTAASFGIDNGVFVWLNGKLLGGYVRKGGATPVEWSISMGNLCAD